MLSIMNLTEKIKSAGTIVVTALIFIFVAMWSVAVWRTLGKAPVYFADGKTVKVDEFLRAKDIFVLVLPLLTTAIGYWLGSQGTVKAEKKADEAEAGKTVAQKTAHEAASGEAAARAKLEYATQMYPEAFNPK